ncbi:MAG TPA: hypothetical protein VLM85_11470 [Polyangiaceae bacterium]|nr:hypothetical protein [Polyangiaceae bacterium]
MSESRAPDSGTAADAEIDAGLDAATDAPFFPCATGSAPASESGDGSTKTLLGNLQYPSGLWLWGNVVYYTETAARNTTFGGALRLSSYDVPSMQSSVIVNDPMNSDAVVVASNGDIYLGSYKNSSPGGDGDVSVISHVTHIETQVVHLAVAVQDMYIDDADDIYVIGPNEGGPLPEGELSAALRTRSTRSIVERLLEHGGHRAPRHRAG